MHSHQTHTISSLSFLDFNLIYILYEFIPSLLLHSFQKLLLILIQKTCFHRIQQHSLDILQIKIERICTGKVIHAQVCLKHRRVITANNNLQPIIIKSNSWMQSQIVNPSQSIIAQGVHLNSNILFLDYIIKT